MMLFGTTPEYRTSYLMNADTESVFGSIASSSSTSISDDHPQTTQIHNGNMNLNERISRAMHESPPPQPIPPYRLETMDDWIMAEDSPSSQALFDSPSPQDDYDEDEGDTTVVLERKEAIIDYDLLAGPGHTSGQEYCWGVLVPEHANQERFRLVTPTGAKSESSYLFGRNPACDLT